MKSLGQIAFEAYGAAVGGKTYDDKPIPQWSEVKPTVQQGWEAAAEAATAQSTVVQMPMGDDTLIWETMLCIYHKLKAAKPDDRSERARRYAVTITEYEKVLSYFNTFVREGFDA